MRYIELNLPSCSSNPALSDGGVRFRKERYVSAGQEGRVPRSLYSTCTSNYAIYSDQAQWKRSVPFLIAYDSDHSDTHLVLLVSTATDLGSL